MLKETVARFVEKKIIPHADECDEQEKFPAEVFRAMGSLGLFGISIPEEYVVRRRRVHTIKERVF